MPLVWMCSGRPQFDALPIMRSMAQVLAGRRGVLIWSVVLGLLQASADSDGYKRRARGEPIAYITGKKGFWDIELNVDERVLVPRPFKSLTEAAPDCIFG